MTKVDTKAAEGQEILAQIESCVETIEKNLVLFARLIKVLLDDPELMRAAGWETEAIMFGDPVVRRGFAQAIDLTSEQQVYRLKRMLELDNQLPDADILVSPFGWTDITQTKKIREIEEVVKSDAPISEKEERAREIVYRPKAETEPDESHEVQYNSDEKIIYVDGIPAIKLVTKNQNQIARFVSRLYHNNDRMVLDGSEHIIAMGNDGDTQIGEIILPKIDDREKMVVWILKRLRARRAMS